MSWRARYKEEKNIPGKENTKDAGRIPELRANGAEQRKSRREIRLFALSLSIFVFHAQDEKDPFRAYVIQDRRGYESEKQNGNEELCG